MDTTFKSRGPLTTADEISAGRDSYRQICDELTTREVSTLLHRLRERTDGRSEVIDRFLKQRNSERLDELLSQSSMDQVESLAALSEEQQQDLRFLVRKASQPLAIELPLPAPTIQPLAGIVFAIVGAVLGMICLGTICNWLLGIEGDTGMMVGAPLGAGIGVALVFFLAHRPRIISILKWTCLIAGLGDMAATIYDNFQPLSLLRKSLFGTKPLRSTLWKRLLAYAVAWLLLHIARPKRVIVDEDVRTIVGQGIRAWLSHQVDLILWIERSIAAGASGCDDAEPAVHPGALLESLAGLSLAVDHQEEGQDPQAILDAALEAVSQFAVNYDVEKSEPAEFSPSLRQAYDTFGVVSEGDPVRVLKYPIRSGSEVVVRGMLARNASTRKRAKNHVE